jgi:hypothetical protein
MTYRSAKSNADIKRTVRARHKDRRGAARNVCEALLISLPDFGKGSVGHVRETLGLPSSEGARPGAKKAAR